MNQEKMMDKMIVVIFDNETKAYEGIKALQEMHEEGSIDLYAKAVIARDARGQLEVKQHGDMGPVGMAVGLLTGSLVGMIGGPLGFTLGASIGTYGGLIFDLAHLGIGQDFLTEVENSLQPGKAAVVAEIGEEWTLPLDTCMEALGGLVLRRTRSEVLDDQVKQETAAIKADLAELEAEYHQATAESKAKLQKKIDAARDKLRAAQDDIQAGLEASQLETEAKIKFLHEQAARDDEERKAKREARIAELKHSQKRRSDQLKQAWELAKEALSK
jgi:uncharacterized membrane protein